MQSCNGRSNILLHNCISTNHSACIACYNYTTSHISNLLQLLYQSALISFQYKGDVPLSYNEHYNYLSIIGSLSYLAICTWLDIYFAFSIDNFPHQLHDVKFLKIESLLFLQSRYIFDVWNGEGFLHDVFELIRWFLLLGFSSYVVTVLSIDATMKSFIPRLGLCLSPRPFCVNRKVSLFTSLKTNAFMRRRRGLMFSFSFVLYTPIVYTSGSE